MNKERAGRREAILLVSGVLLLVLAAASICMGAVPVTLRELAEVLTTGETTTSAGRIIWFVRMPRTLAAILAGSALAVSGAVLQTVLNNPLASPSIIGVNAGSGLFTIALAAFFPGAVRYTPAAALPASGGWHLPTRSAWWTATTGGRSTWFSTTTAASPRPSKTANASPSS